MGLDHKAVHIAALVRGGLIMNDAIAFGWASVDGSGVVGVLVGFWSIVV